VSSARGARGRHVVGRLGPGQELAEPLGEGRRALEVEGSGVLVLALHEHEAHSVSHRKPSTQRSIASPPESGSMSTKIFSMPSSRTSQSLFQVAAPGTPSAGMS